MTSEAGNTSEKPQSKVWKYEGKWWSVFPTTTAGASAAGTWLWKLNLTNWTWEEVLKLTTATDIRADVKVVGTLAHILLFQGESTQLASVEYSGGTYQFWSTRPALVSISLPNSETATIDVELAKSNVAGFRGRFDRPDRGLLQLLTVQHLERAASHGVERQR